MSSSSIAQASKYINDLLDCLEDIYWESNSVDVKDQCFNLVRLLQREVTELTKISVQDHHYPYEVIICRPHIMLEAITDLEEILSGEVLRAKSRQQIRPLLTQAENIFNPT